jgi:hypothetical protein
MNLELFGLRQETTTQQIDELKKPVERDAENIRALARIAEIHEHRLTDLDDKN